MSRQTVPTSAFSLTSKTVINMKMNYAAMAFALAGLCIASCSKEQMDEGRIEPSSEKVELRIAAGEPGTKTTFTDPAGGDYNVKWQDNTDKIGLFIAKNTVNAEAGLTRTKEGKAYFLSEVSGYEAGNILYAYYPYAASSEGETIAATAVKLTIPAEQTQTNGFNGSYDPMVAVPVELPAQGNAVEEPLKFRHLGAMVELKVKSAEKHVGESITSVSFTARDGKKVAGEFNFDLTKVAETGALAEYAGSSETVTVTLEKPVALTDKGVSVSLFMTVIPGSYTGVFTVTTSSAVATEEGEPTVKTHTYSYASGYEYKRASVTRYTLDLDNAKAMANEIRTVADWEAFVDAVKGGADYAGKVVSLINDITAENLSVATGTFNGKFAGNGHSITQTANTRPLFETLGENAEVTNLTLAGAFASFEKPYEWGNAALAKVNLGTVSNVTVNCPVSLKLTDEPSLFGSIVAQNGGTLKDCTNDGNVSLTINIAENRPNEEEVAIANLGGGVAAYGHTLAPLDEKSGLYTTDANCRPGKFRNCVNNGNISVTASGNGDGQLKVLGVSTYGGICGIVELDGVVFENCRNTGAISRISAGEGSIDASSCVGGILGRCAGTFALSWTHTNGQIYINVNKSYEVSLSNCVNSGNLMLRCRHSDGVNPDKNGARLDNVGGIAGAMFGKDDKKSKIEKCVNNGTVSGGWSNGVNTTVLGGIAGCAKNVEMVGCTADGSLSAVENTCVGAAGGFAGFVFKGVSVSGASSCGAAFKLAKVNKNLAMLWGFAFGNVQTNATIDGASFGCSANIDGTELELTADNFKDYLCNTGSKVQPTVTNCTWSK